VKTITFALSLLCSCVSAAYAGDQTAQELFLSAKKQANLFAGQSSPFQLDVDFVTQLNVPRKGHLTLKWEKTDRWWRNIRMESFEQTEVRNGEMLYTVRNFDFTPPRIAELISMLQFPDSKSPVSVKQRKERSERDSQMICFQVQQPDQREKHELCLEGVTHDIMTDEWKQLADEKREERYSAYKDFAGHRYPRKLELLVNGIKMTTADVTKLELIDFNESLLTPPKGAIERRQCAGLKHATPVKTPDPAYPRSASENRMSGDSTVAMTVLQDGSVTDIHLVGSASRSMDEATLQTLKTWRFKAAMCGSDPVISDIEVIVSFRLQ